MLINGSPLLRSSCRNRFLRHLRCLLRTKCHERIDPHRANSGCHRRERGDDRQHQRDETERHRIAGRYAEQKARHRLREDEREARPVIAPAARYARPRRRSDEQSRCDERRARCARQFRGSSAGHRRRARRRCRTAAGAIARPAHAPTRTARKRGRAVASRAMESRVRAAPVGRSLSILAIAARTAGASIAAGPSLGRTTSVADHHGLCASGT